jgi:hypothetical protein
MSYTKLKDARSTYSLDSLRLNIKNKQNIAPQKGAVELYVKNNKLYMMLDDGTEYEVGYQAEQEIKRITVSNNYQVSTDDYYVGITAGGLTITLPKASLVNNGHTVVIKDESGLGTTVNASTGDKIDTNILPATATLLAYESVTLVCNGADKWLLI